MWMFWLNLIMWFIAFFYLHKCRKKCENKTLSISVLQPTAEMYKQQVQNCLILK